MGNHGGKREGAGREPKWDILTKVKIGQECEVMQKKEDRYLLIKKRFLIIIREEVHLRIGQKNL